MVAVQKVLIANRGVCACRIMKTCRTMGIDYVTIFTDSDYQSLHVTQSTEKYLVRSYMDIDDILRVAKASSSDAIHPGYGFQAENPVFPQKCSETGVRFIGPTAENMLLLGSKVMARQVGKKEEIKLPVAPSSDLITNLQEALEWGDVLGYPVLLKSPHGGGGIGIELCENHEQLAKKFSARRAHYTKLLGCGDIYMEKFIPKARHIEVQVFGDGKGNVIHLGERECSVQRRYQKLIEESPSAALTQELRDQVCELAVRLCKSQAYQSVGTVEFLFDDVQKQFYFLEVNTRLQVEHRVTELRYGIDLVEWMIRQVCEETAIDLTAVAFQPHEGHAIECRIVAEDPLNNFKPTTGTLTEVIFPEQGHLGSRRCLVDTWIHRGCPVSSNYDPLLANIISWAPTRKEAIQAMVDTLDGSTVAGPPNNLDYFRKFLATDAFAKGQTYSDALIRFSYTPLCVEVIAPGLLTTVQDWPGRQGQGLWRIGVPPSGSMDHLASRIANSLLANEETAAVLELTQRGPTLKFHCDASIVITGAAMEATVDHKPIKMWQRTAVNAGSVVTIGALTSGLGLRAYLGVTGGFDVPKYLGSRATFPNGNFGGHQGRALRAGDVIPIGSPRGARDSGQWNERLDGVSNTEIQTTKSPDNLPTAAIGNHDRENHRSIGNLGSTGNLDNTDNQRQQEPGNGVSGVKNIKTDPGQLFDPTPVTSQYSSKWWIGVLPGPHANPEYLTDKDMKMFYSTDWLVHHNSNRLGIRLSGPAPEWARSDGEEGGSHPSNIHDCEYAIGTINFTGNMPIIIAQDGPSLGGFVCPCTIAQSELWKIGQVKAGDSIRFWKMTIEEAIRARRVQNEFIRTLVRPAMDSVVNSCVEMYPKTKAVLRMIPKSETRPRVEIRLAGDSYVLIEYGPMVLDLNLRFRVHFLEEVLLQSNIAGLEETAPGVRSLQLRYDPLVLPLSTLLEVVTKADDELQDISQRSIPTRILHLPMCFDYSGVQEAIEKYMKSVRPHAPYLPSNIEYIYKNNGLRGVSDVRERVFSASYMCIGLGDVYLGASCAVPINPLHRLVTSKYNPARTYTQEGTVGLGGSYMCIYPMNSPGGYQLIGRTLPIWDSFGTTNPKLFSTEKPWLLKMFDQIRFHSVSETELDEMRSKFKRGELEIRVEDEIFSIPDYNRSVNAITKEIESYRQAQKQAADVMLKEDEKSLKKLESENDKNRDPQRDCVGTPQMNSIADGSVEVFSPMTGKIWEITVSVGEFVPLDHVVATIEAMKMECPCHSPVPGTVSHIVVSGRQFVHQGDLIMIINNNY